MRRDTISKGQESRIWAKGKKYTAEDGRRKEIRILKTAWTVALYSQQVHNIV